MHTALPILVLILAAALAYTYFGYALLLDLLWRIRPRRVLRRGEVGLRVSLVIPAYNEAQAIEGKLDNVLALDFPPELLEILVVSDASTDETDEIVRRFAARGVELVRLPARGGKIAAYRSVFPRLTGDVVVFSDATSILERDALTRLLSNFADPSVGCVGAQVSFVNPEEAAVGKGVNVYWDYESFIRTRESDLSSLVSVSGTLYGVRRSLYPADMRDDLADDLVVPFHVKAMGYRTVFDPSVRCVESTTIAVDEEMAKRTRITIQNIRGLVNHPAMMNPLRHGLFALFVISHKLLRLLVPVLLILTLGLSLWLGLSEPLFLGLAALQVAFYLMGFAGYRMRSEWHVRVLNVAFYFCLSNVAILVGIWRYFGGTRVATWETLRGRPQ